MEEQPPIAIKDKIKQNRDAALKRAVDEYYSKLNKAKEYFNDNRERLEKLFLERSSCPSFITTDEELWGNESVESLTSVICEEFGLTVTSADRISDDGILQCSYLWMVK